MSATVLNFGSINIDHVYQVPQFVQPGETLASLSLATGLGGKGANQSVALARAGVNVAHIGRIHASDAWAVEIMQDSGVDTSLIEQVDEPSGHAIIQIDPYAENAIILHGGANQNFQIDALQLAIDKNPSAKYLLMQNECNLLEQAFDLAVQRGLKVVLNPAPMTSNVLNLPLSNVDTLIVNQVEAQGLTNHESLDDIIAALQKLCKKSTVVITLGADGVILLQHDEVVRVDAQPVSAVDTTGAGDTFVGYFLAGLISGQSNQDALQQACQAAAIAVSRSGAISAIPQLSELN